ncbi:MAG: NmrA/HSCARG family protein [Myxococcales bacterium]|nr:NmrA/HSCARG family protein [Myxococcales bacterium]
MNTSKKIIAVVGATGAQGGGVVKALAERGTFRVRALTRDPSKAEGLADEVVRADLDDPASLAAAFAGAHGVFVVTNFWAGADELAQGQRAIAAAKEAGVDHFIWSTLPDVEALTDGTLDVPHFTNKAHVDALVAAAGFAHHTFVEPPFYYQNLAGALAPQPAEDGSKVFRAPMDPSAKVILMGDITEFGRLVAAAFERADEVGSGQHLAQCGALASGDDVVAALRDQGHRVSFQRVPAEHWDQAFPGAAELREMMEFFERHTYFGPDAAAKIAAADAIVDAPFTDLATWTRANLEP